MVSAIRQLAAERGLTMRQIISLAGVSTSIYKWDTQSPTLQKLEAVAEALGVDVCEIIKRTRIT